MDWRDNTDLEDQDCVSACLSEDRSFVNFVYCVTIC